MSFFNQNTSIFAYMSALAEKHKAINLSQGFPDFPVDPKLIDCVVKAMHEGFNQYAPMPGWRPLREKLSVKHHSDYAVTYNPETEITITPGATQALQSVFASTIRPNDEVVLFAPAYDSYAPMIKACGGKVVWVELSPSDFSVPHQKLTEAVSSNTRLIVINNPHNPSGAVWKEEDVLLLEALQQKFGFFVLADEVYEKICFLPSGFESLTKSEILRPSLFLVYSFGKTFHATGWKLGYVLAPENLMKELRSYFQYAVFSVNTPMQKGIADYLDSVDLNEVAKMYMEKQQFFENEMKKTKLRPLPTYGSYFQLYDYSEVRDDIGDVEMAEWLTVKAGVATIPVSVFYPNPPTHMRYLRFCFAKKNENLSRAALALAEL
jgi:methionine aminotransferase